MTPDTTPRVLVLDVTPDLPGGAHEALAPHFAPVTCVGVEDLVYRLHRERADAVVLDGRYDSLEAPELLAQVRAKARSGADLPVLVIVPSDIAPPLAATLLQAGAHDLVTLDLVDPLLVHRLRKLLRTRALQAILAEWEAGERRQRESFESAAAEQSLAGEAVSGWRVKAHTMACPAYAGDFAFSLAVSPHRQVIAIGDALGSGPSVLARTATLRGVLAACSRSAATPGAALAAANAVACGLLGPESYCRVWIAFLDAATGTIAYSHAGQPGMALWSAIDGARHNLAPGGPPLGADPDATYDDGSSSMAPGARLLVGTPGAIVVHCGEEAEASLARLGEVLDSVAGDKFDTAWRLLWSRVTGFHQQSVDTHDMTLLFAERDAE